MGGGGLKDLTVEAEEVRPVFVQRCELGEPCVELTLGNGVVGADKVRIKPARLWL
jgi:hypothetical protein